MKISKKQRENCLILILSGRLDSNTSPEVERYILGIDNFGEQNVIIDMAELDYISSAGLRLILHNSKTLEKKERSFVLCRMQDHIKEVFEISGFDTFLQIYDSLEEPLGHS